MRDIAELTGKTSSYELFAHVYWQIVSRKLTRFDELVEYLTPVEEGARKEYVLQAAFPLIREIHWGFFRELNPKSYPQLWGELTLTHPVYPFAGELKRSITIPDIYCAFVDIHGYTAFSRSARDSAMLRLLDDAIESDVKRICRENHVAGNRARGDEIILVGTSAYDVVNSVVLIADYFGERRYIGDSDVMKKRRRDGRQLPKMTVSAGVAGGNKYTSLVITATGDLSGTTVNAAARLQSRANVVSPDSCVILTTQNVRVKYEAEAAELFVPRFTPGQVAFRDLGPFGFKGVELRLTELLTHPEQMHRLQYRDELDRLIETVEKKRWTDAVFNSAGELLLACLAAKTPPEPAGAGIAGCVRSALGRYEDGLDYTGAVSDLTRAAVLLEQVPGADPFVLLYVRSVAAEYGRIVRSFSEHLESFVDEHRHRLMSPDENAAYEGTRVLAAKRDTLKAALLGRVSADKRRQLWNRMVEETGPALEEARYLGK